MTSNNSNGTRDSRTWAERIHHPKWLLEGSNPDYRFTLANERTFLAWIRTALAIIAAAVLLHQMAPASSSNTFHLFVPVALVIFAGALVVSAYIRWRTYEMAMRHGKALPAGMGFVPIAVLSMLIGCLVAATLWSSR